MTCATCATRIERKLNRLDGVAATVNFATGTAHVRHPQAITLPDLVSTVEGLGYTAQPAAGEAPAPAYGLRVRLRADFDLSPYTGDALVILSALKKYGLIFADQGSAWYVTGTSDPRWETALDQLRSHKVYGRDFEVVQMGSITSC